MVVNTENIIVLSLLVEIRASSPKMVDPAPAPMPIGMGGTWLYSGWLLSDIIFYCVLYYYFDILGSKGMQF